MDPIIRRLLESRNESNRGGFRWESQIFDEKLSNNPLIRNLSEDLLSLIINIKSEMKKSESIVVEEAGVESSRINPVTYIYCEFTLQRSPGELLPEEEEYIEERLNSILLDPDSDEYEYSHEAGFFKENKLRVAFYREKL